MKINPAFTIKPLGKAVKNQPVAHAEKTDRPKEKDTVAFSKELQQVQGKENSVSVDTDRQARIRDIKEQIANGSYAPDSKKVALSLIKYIVKETGSKD